MRPLSAEWALVWGRELDWEEPMATPNVYPGAQSTAMAGGRRRTSLPLFLGVALAAIFAPQGRVSAQPIELTVDESFCGGLTTVSRDTRLMMTRSIECPPGESIHVVARGDQTRVVFEGNGHTLRLSDASLMFNTMPDGMWGGYYPCNFNFCPRVTFELSDLAVVNFEGGLFSFVVGFNGLNVETKVRRVRVVGGTRYDGLLYVRTNRAVLEDIQTEGVGLGRGGKGVVIDSEYDSESYQFTRVRTLNTADGISLQTDAQFTITDCDLPGAPPGAVGNPTNLPLRFPATFYERTFRVEGSNVRSNDESAPDVFVYTYGNGTSGSGTLVLKDNCYGDVRSIVAGRPIVIDGVDPAATCPHNIVVDVPTTAAAGRDRHALIGVPVTFSSLAADPHDRVVSYSWDFGDGSAASGPTAIHAYARPGLYLATLTVADLTGSTSTDVVEVRVMGLPGAPLEGVIWDNGLAGIADIHPAATFRAPDGEGWSLSGEAVADDFELTETTTLAGVSALFLSLPDPSTVGVLGLIVAVLEDDAGQPGELIAWSDHNTITTARGGGAFLLERYTAELTEPVVLAPGRYWLALAAEVTTENNLAFVVANGLNNSGRALRGWMTHQRDGLGEPTYYASWDWALSSDVSFMLLGPHDGAGWEHSPDPVDGDGCTPGDPAACDDGDPCTTDRCDPASGQCDNTIEAGLPCDDGFECSTEDTCDESGVCVGGNLDDGYCSGLAGDSQCVLGVCAPTAPLADEVGCAITNLDFGTIVESGVSCGQNACDIGLGDVVCDGVGGQVSTCEPAYQGVSDIGDDTCSDDQLVVYALVDDPLTGELRGSVRCTSAAGVLTCDTDGTDPITQLPLMKVYDQLLCP